MTQDLASDPPSDIHQHPIEGEDVGFVKDNPVDEGRTGSPSFTQPPSRGSRAMMDDGWRIVSSKELLRRYKDRLDEPDRDLWGSYIRAGAVTLLNGETSTGKTVFLHHLAVHLAEGNEFLGLKPPKPLKVLSIDFESYDDILEDHFNMIGTSENWRLVDFDFDEGAILRGQALIKQLEQTILKDKYDLVVVDPLMEAYPTEHENDNAQGSTQMIAFRKLARKTGAAIVLVHNTGKPNVNQKKDYKFLGRGASTRSDRADVVVNFVLRGDNARQIIIVKTRGRDMGACITFKFAGDLDYELVESGVVSPGKIAELQERSAALVRERCVGGEAETERKDMVHAFGIETRSDQQALDRALARNLKTDKLAKVRKGVYTLPPPREVVSINVD